MSTTKKQSPQNTIILFVKIVEKFLSFMIIKFLQLKKKIADDLNMSLTKRVHQLSATCKDNNCAHSKN